MNIFKRIIQRIKDHFVKPTMKKVMTKKIRLHNLEIILGHPEILEKAGAHHLKPHELDDYIAKHYLRKRV
ncbi:MAG: hypothetical protein JW827_11285 [Spirochaetes bacterium]|nr:hypothetical protein [Spirochaetota bacterium]